MSANAGGDRGETPAENLSVGLGRKILETRNRLGPAATPEQVAGELKVRGVEATVDQVKAAWGTNPQERT